MTFVQNRSQKRDFGGPRISVENVKRWGSVMTNRESRTQTLFGLVIALVSAIGVVGCGSSPPNQAKLTWVAVADWTVDIGSLHMYLDGALTRFDPTNLYGGLSGLSYSHVPVCFSSSGGVAKDTDQRVLAALEHTPNYHLTGHSNLDHSYDTGTMAKVTRAPIIGSPSTCFQVQAQGIPASECRSVFGGEKIDLGEGVTVRIVRWNHSGSTANADLHDPRELVRPPTPDPTTGCFHPGVVEDFPNGGGGRGLLFTAGSSGHHFSWFFVDTGSDFDFEQPIYMNDATGMVAPAGTGTNYGAPKDNLIAAMRDAGLTSVDLWIGLASLPFAQKVIPILRPKAFIPNHQGSFYTDFFLGLTTPFQDTALEAYLTSQNVTLLKPLQYMDAWNLDSTGTVSTPNVTVKQRLGFF